MVPLDRGPCVSSRPFAHFFLKCAPLPHKTITPQSRPFCCSAVFCHPCRRFALFASSNFVFIPLRGSNERPLSRIRLSPPTPAPLLLSSGAPICDPCRGSGSATFVFTPSRGSTAQPSDPCRGCGSPRPTLILSCLPPGLHSAIPVEDSALSLHPRLTPS